MPVPQLRDIGVVRLGYAGGVAARILGGYKALDARKAAGIAPPEPVTEAEFEAAEADPDDLAASDVTGSERPTDLVTADRPTDLVTADRPTDVTEHTARLAREMACANGRHRAGSHVGETRRVDDGDRLSRRWIEEVETLR